MTFDLPQMLDIPDKLLPFIYGFNDYEYFVIEGGRGSGKTQSIARFLLYLADKYPIRIVCGRETQSSIEESVYTVFRDLISEYELDYEIQSTKINHRSNGSTIRFKGFREQGNVNIKGLEGVDILWIDEAQAITKQTIDIIIPTIRKPNSKIIFSMNRFLIDDPAYYLFASRNDCLNIHIDYFENHHCTLKLKKEAEECKRRSEKDYNHIWLGQPLARADDYLFTYAKLLKAKTILPFGDLFKKQSVMGIDVAGKGSDLCVATLMVRESDTHWRMVVQESWDEPDTMVSVGRIIALLGKYNPDVACIDVGGLGYPMYNRIREVGIKKMLAFDGSLSSKEPNARNTRAEGYLLLREWFDNEWLIVESEETLKELQHIKMVHNSQGKILIQSKEDMREEGYPSPDKADSLMMSVYAIKNFLGKVNVADLGQLGNVTRKSERSQFRKGRR